MCGDRLCCDVPHNDKFAVRHNSHGKQRYVGTAWMPSVWFQHLRIRVPTIRHSQVAAASATIKSSTIFTYEKGAGFGSPHFLTLFLSPPERTLNSFLHWE